MPHAAFQSPSLQPISVPGQINPGSSVAALWIQVSQDNQPPASIPSTLQAVEHCPTCGHRLYPPLKPAERQCLKCGWSDQTHNLLQEGGRIGKADLMRLLEQAAAESLDNMKPRKKPG